MTSRQKPSRRITDPSRTARISLGLLTVLGASGLWWGGSHLLQAAESVPQAQGAPAPIAPAAPASGAGEGDAAFTSVKKVLESRCFNCHGGEKTKSGFNMASAERLRQGGSRGDPLAGEKPLMLSAIQYSHDEVRMPPTGQLPEAERAILAQWLASGAPWPAGVTLLGKAPVADEESLKPTLEEGRRWWAYQPPPSSIPIPAVDDPAYAAHPVDAFIYAKLKASGIRPAPEADRATLIRRATFDLTGLPPTPEEVQAFLEDAQPGAWERLVDRLLASPHYGEQQARQWMDVVRFAETNGYERDSEKPNMWRYRDWLIRSANADMPYDRFILEQLAGDELPDATPSSRLATGYYRLCLWDDEPVDRVQARADELADIVDTTGQAFLATTVGCARCHDHKKDPITQRDYYALTAFFSNIEGFSYKAGRHVADPWAPAGAARMTESERRAQLVAMDAEVDAVLKTFQKAWADRGAPMEKPGRVLVADARSEAVTWRFSEQKADGWETPGFADGAWCSGVGGFGRQGTPGAVVRTAWEGKDIFLRTRFNLTEIPEQGVLKLHHDDDVEVWLNGALIYQAKGYGVQYEEIQLPPAAVSQLVVGSNVLAIHCRQDFGGQYIDAGLATGWAAGRSGWLAKLRAYGDQYLSAESWRAFQELERQQQALAAAQVGLDFVAQVVAERPGPPPVQHVLGRGSVHAEREAVAPGVPLVMTDPATPPLVVPAEKRRLALARWIANPANPMTAKVCANRVFQQHFGRGLAPTPGDFGKLGMRPTHPELLDFLASALVRGQWSIKSLHRLIMTSRAYRMSGAVEASPADVDNNLLGRFNVRRLSAEEFRDAVLSVSGQLNPKMYGPSVYPPMPAEVLAGASRPTEVWHACAPEDVGRRSLYVFTKRSLRYPLLEVFDQPDTDQGCHARFGTLTPTQSLTTLNSDFMQDAANAFARRLEREHPDDPAAQIHRGLFLAFGRAPAADALARHLDFLNKLEERKLPPGRALACLCLAILNENNFLFKE